MPPKQPRVPETVELSPGRMATFSPGKEATPGHARDTMAGECKVKVVGKVAMGYMVKGPTSKRSFFAFASELEPTDLILDYVNGAFSKSNCEQVHQPTQLVIDPGSSLEEINEQVLEARAAEKEKKAREQELWEANKARAVQRISQSIKDDMDGSPRPQTRAEQRMSWASLSGEGKRARATEALAKATKSLLSVAKVAKVGYFFNLPQKTGTSSLPITTLLPTLIPPSAACAFRSSTCPG